jgi:hypothetical protein
MYRSRDNTDTDEAMYYIKHTLDQHPELKEYLVEKAKLSKKINGTYTLNVQPEDLEWYLRKKNMKSFKPEDKGKPYEYRQH